MNIYIDSSVLLRKLLNERNAIKTFPETNSLVSSALLRVECLRVLDRLRFKHSIKDAQVVERHTHLFSILERVELIDISPDILDFACQPFPTTIRTLDAIHISSAILWKRFKKQDITIFTHDIEMGLAARAFGLPVIGC